MVEMLPPCIVAMEACCGAHYLGRIFADQQHQVRLMSPEYVQPYAKAQKNDDRDAEAIAEAATRPTMRFVELKSQEQLDMQTLHRARDRLVGERTALINQLRAILLERGIVVPQGRGKLERDLAILLDENQGAGLSPRVAKLIRDTRTEWNELDPPHKGIRQRVCSLRKGRRRGSASGLDSRHRRDDRFGADRGHRQGREFLLRDAISQPGLVWFLSNPRPVEDRVFPGSASEAINTYEGCSSMAPAQRYRRSRTATPRWDAGQRGCSRGRTKISSW